MRRTKVFTLVPFYLPGFKSGGPVRTIANMVDHLSERVEFHIYCLDRDAGDESAYPDIVPEVWTTVGNPEVYYSRSRWWGLSDLRRRIGEVGPDFVYLNSFFAPFCFRYLIFRKLGLL